MVDEGVGFLYEPGNGTGLRADVMRLVSDPLLRRRMQHSARSSVEGRSWEVVNAMLVDHYLDVMVGTRLSQAS